MKKFIIYFFGFVIVFFIAPAICTVTSCETQEIIEGENVDSVYENEKINEINIRQGNRDGEYRGRRGKNKTGRREF